MDDRHKTHLVDLIDEEPALVLDQMMDSLTAEFIDLEISKTALYNFVNKECKISLKRAHFHSVERNCLEKITARKEWVEKWMATDMDYMSNCVFIDEAAFHINMKRSIAWSKVGTRAVVKIPKTRAKTTTILGATCAFGVVNIKVRRPRVMPTSKKRKTVGSSGQAQTQSKGTVTGHYFNFISDTMDEMDKHPEIFKDNYLIMDNAPIHTNDDIKLLIESRGYRCVYLPPYSPELNPIEQFWSICKMILKDFISLPPRGKIYSINEGNYRYFDEPSKKYVDQVKQKYSARYVGSMVSDIHRTLLYGGIFGYPTDSKSKKGKLKILYEVFPMAFLIEQAGGKATTGTMDCLDLVPEHIHDRSGIWLGSKEDVENLEACYKA
ncbi:uncharacterized protein ATC70_006981 [Mucor velutinosus]|uniref:Fructose-1,6-bisphosphatase n=1 Tax=Mucor velutinosus TaxID=708070 RepID=A0AAN7D3S7_9FUNG|nr:hypothetical protein ATC70_006981 [Mucor velutinosus]